MRRTLIVVAITGCSFNPPRGDDDGGGQPPDGSVPLVNCHSTDSELRLCVDFESPPPNDGSPDHLTLTTDRVVAMDRVGPEGAEHAVMVDATSSMRVAESPALDLTGDFTLELWIDATRLPMSGTRYWMFDNNTQYAMELKDDGTMRCVIGSDTLDTVGMVTAGRWTHVACVYHDGDLEAFLDGNNNGCHSANPPVTTGTVGSAIGANVGAGGLTEQFVGGLDNVRVYARALEASEICRLATGGTSCDGGCPES
jgi:hypothetical protein